MVYGFRGQTPTLKTQNPKTLNPEPIYIYRMTPNGNVLPVEPVEGHQIGYIVVHHTEFCSKNLHRRCSAAAAYL